MIFFVPVSLHSSINCSERLGGTLILKGRACLLQNYNQAWEQALLGALVAGWEKEGELATTSVESEFHLQFPCGSPSTELSNFRQSARSGNERECKQTLKNTCQG